MATIRKRGPYQWEAQIRRKGFPHQQKTFNTKNEASAWASMIESEMSRGIWVSRSEAEETTLLEALVRYGKEITPTKKSVITETSSLRILANEELATRTMASIRSSDIAHLRDAWLKEYKAATVLRRLQLLSHVFNIARKEWGMESLANPVELVRKPKPNDSRSRRISTSQQGTDELECIIKATGSTLLPSILHLAVETAMRRSEIVNLRWENIDLERRVAHLPATKNGSPRDVPLSTKATEVLQALRDACGGDTSTGRVFHLREDAVTRAFERAVSRARGKYVQECKEASIRPDEKFLADLRFHDLRHEATSRLAQTFQLAELTKVTGHKDPRMLMRYYHPRAEDLAKRLA